MPEFDLDLTHTVADQSIPIEDINLTKETQEQEYPMVSQNMTMNSEVRKSIADAAGGTKDQTSCTSEVRNCNCNCAGKSLELEVEGVKLDVAIL